jgi:hypothetical protein
MDFSFRIEREMDQLRVQCMVGEENKRVLIFIS